MAGVVLILAGALAALLGAQAVARSDAERERLASHLASAEIASTLKLAIRREEDLTVDTSAFVANNPDVTAVKFDQWVESMHAAQRYPELQNLGLVMLVRASKLPAFEARMAADPLRPQGSRSTASAGDFQIVPEGKRAYYCLAVAGIARNLASDLPPGLDYCQLVKTMIKARSLGVSGYAPVADAGATALGVETPVYRGGATPRTVKARIQAFQGWLGERIEPKILLETALAGHPGAAVVFRFNSRYSHVAFTSGKPSPGAQSTTVALAVGREAGLPSAHEGWTVQSFSAGVVGGVLADSRALALLVGGILLSVLLGLLVTVLGTGRVRAWSLVREKTRELSEKNRELFHMTLHDPLTGLPNRLLVVDRAERMLARSARDPQIVAGALFVDVDDFKHVNDSLGHATGDQLLRVVGARLQSAVRDQDTVGRLGGDEFVVLVESRTGDTELVSLADRITGSLGEPVELDDGSGSFSVTVSIGVAGGHHDTADALLRDADRALYVAKAAGKDRYTLFNAGFEVGDHMAQHSAFGAPAAIAEAVAAVSPERARSGWGKDLPVPAPKAADEHEEAETSRPSSSYPRRAKSRRAHRPKGPRWWSSGRARSEKDMGSSPRP
jgi:diguanylate cyclase (GGDEF)-like protein